MSEENDTWRAKECAFNLLKSTGEGSEALVEAGALLLAITCGGRPQASDEGAIKVLTSALQQHAGVAAVCQWASLALAFMTSGTHLADACVEAGAIPALLGALEQHRESARVCETASHALACIASSCDTHREACVKAGAALPSGPAPHEQESAATDYAVRRAVELLASSGEGSKELVGAGTLALAMIARDAGDKRNPYVNGGALPVVVHALPLVANALQQHAEVAAVCEWASLVLAYMISSTTAGVCVEAGAIPALVGALTQHARDTQVCKATSLALASIASSSGAEGAYRDACVRAGAVLKLVEARVRHVQETATYEAVSKALNEIGHESIPACACHDAAPELVSRLRECLYTVGMCRNLCIALGDIANNEAGAEHCRRADAFSVLLEVLDHHKQEPDVCAAACGALRNMLVLNECKEEYFRGNVRYAVAHMMRTHESEASVCIAGCGVLASMAQFEQKKDGTSGFLLGILHSLLHRHSCMEGSGAVCEAAFNALASIGYTQSDFLISVAQAHPQCNAALQRMRRI